MICRNSILLVVVAGIAGCATPLTGATRADDAAALRHLKIVEWRRLYDEGDADGLAAFLADDFMLIGGEAGFSPKTAEVDWLRHNDWVGPADFRYTIEDIVFLNDDAAIVYGRGTSTRTNAQGHPCRHSYLSSNTFRRERGAWRPVTSHVSDATCSGEPD